MKTTKKPKILIDSREKTPYSFKSSEFKTKITTLKTGDYTLEGYEEKICIERKTKTDIYQTIASGKRKKRFTNELARMDNIEKKFVIIECDNEEIRIPPSNCGLPAYALIHSLMTMSDFYRVKILFVGCRQGGERFCLEVFSEIGKFRGSGY